MLLKNGKRFYLGFLFCLCSTLVSAGQITDTIVKVRIDLKQKAQVIDNIGASGCWFSEGIGKYWPTAKKEKIAQLLFSNKFDHNGQAEGIGLSAWRFNIGAGTTEQADSSGIKDFRKRTESFLNPDGTYDWTKQSGYRFFLQKAKDYGVANLIAFSNSPPVQFTKNKLGFKTEKDYVANLREDSYTAYAKFLATVIRHFDSQGLHFNYISPVNEPQWDWSHKYKEASQEGSPWTNQEIYKITKALDAAIDQQKLTTKILITEAGMLNYLYGNSGKAAHQLQNFFDQKSPLYVGDLNNVSKIAAGHSYFTESDPKVLFDTRKQLADAIKKYNVAYWQSEYSMLGDGFKEGFKGNRSAMDCALFLAKVIHTDLTVGNATAWQFWNAYEPGNAEWNTRYYLIALKPNADFKDGEFTVTKNLWALGHYSLFIRPGMTRVLSDAVVDDEKLTAYANLLVSAYKDENDKLVVVATNYGTRAVQVKLDITNAEKKYKTANIYLTTSDNEVNMKAQQTQPSSALITIPARSISTVLVN